MPVKIYARVRPMLPFEAGQADIISIKGSDLTIVPPPGDTSFEPKTFTFSAISGQNATNEECFDLICKPMCANVLEGYNSVLMAYGQTGCGKTYTMLGKPDRNVLGLLPRTLQWFTNQNSGEIELSVCEAYSRNVMKIEIFDLLAKVNDAKDWSAKKGSTTMEVKKLTKVKVKDYMHGYKTILQAQGNGHTAPTGKNPESSRGHTMYLVKIFPEQKNATEIIDPSTFVFVDLAGSEGETALTPEFCATHSQEEVLMRRMEGGVINNGLSAIQSIFRELGKAGKLAKVGKVGVRRILLEYISKNSHLSVMFMLSPAQFNVGPTTSTLYFAKAAALVKIKPKKKKARVNWEAVAGIQQTEIEQLKAKKDVLEEDLKKITGGKLPKSLAKSTKSGNVSDDRAGKLEALYEGINEDLDEGTGNKQNKQCNELMFEEEPERTPEEIMAVEDIDDLSPPELLVRAQGLEFLLESEKNLREENEKNKDLFIEYLTEGMNSLRKKMRKLAKAHELLKTRHLQNK